MEVVKGFERAIGKPLNWEYGPRRAGDGARLIANSEKALAKLGWQKTKSLDQMCADSYNFVLTRYNVKKTEPEATEPEKVAEGEKPNETAS